MPVASHQGRPALRKATPMNTNTNGTARRRRTPKPIALKWEVDGNTATAVGARHHYRVHKQRRSWYAQQRQSSGYTPIGGACTEQDQAMVLCQRYENGERQLSHKQWRGVAYRELPAKVA